MKKLIAFWIVVFAVSLGIASTHAQERSVGTGEWRWDTMVGWVETTSAMIDLDAVGNRALADSYIEQSWLQQSALATDADFIERVKMSMVARAVLIVQAESVTPIAFSTQRLALAKTIVSVPDQWAKAFAIAAAADTTIRSTSTDAEINARVASVWNTFAGVQ